MSMPSPQSLTTEVTLASQHADRVIEALSSSAGGGGGRWDDGHAQLILYWAVEERHISHAITAAQRLDVSLQSLLWTRPHHLIFTARRHADALFGCDWSSQRCTHREASSLSYWPRILRRR